METMVANDVIQYLTFNLGDEVYGLDVIHIKEVLGVPRITRVPRMPEYLSRVINLRGSVVPVLDMRQKFGLGPTVMTENTSIIVTELTGMFHDEEAETLTIGLFSDGVEEVVEINPADIEPPPKLGISIDTSFISGMGKLGESFVILLDLKKLLSERELLGGPSEQEESANA